MKGSMIVRSHFVYCVQKTEKGWVLLNRRYKPVGCPSSEWIDYEPYSEKLSISLRKAQKFSANPITKLEDSYWLYNDSCDPTHPEHRPAYMERLLALLECG